MYLCVLFLLTDEEISESYIQYELDRILGAFHPAAIFIKIKTHGQQLTKILLLTQTIFPFSN